MPDQITSALYIACGVVCDSGTLAWIFEVDRVLYALARLLPQMVLWCTQDLPAARATELGRAPATPAALTARHWLPVQGSAALGPQASRLGFQGKPTWGPTFCQLFGVDHAAAGLELSEWTSIGQYAPCCLIGD